VFGNSSVAALTIAAHELGHAMQDKQDSQILKRRDTLSLVAKLLGIFMAPLLIAGVILFFAYPANLVYSVACLAGGIGIFVLALVVKGLTISIEKDASSRAIMLLEQLQVLDEQEIKLAKKLLKAALLTYIADFLRAILGWTMLTQKTKLF
jgi:Zn-dependent membrane protease YugP